jgi:hypothetical protein
MVEGWTVVEARGGEDAGDLSVRYESEPFVRSINY